MADQTGGSPCLHTNSDFEGRRTALVWQAMKPNRVPHAIWRAASEFDIIEALSYARALGLQVSIVSGGHSYIGHGIQDGTLVLDLSAMKGMAIDVERRCGWIEPGVRVAEFDAALDRAGLAFPIGHDPNVGLVGYLLGGGLGWNPDQWNSIACFNITAAEIVVPSGERVRADSERHTDLFWAVRGAGPNFCGVVTRLHVQLFPRPAVIRKSDYVFSLAALEAVLSWLARMHEKLEEGIELSLFFSVDAMSGVQCAVSIIVFAETEAEAIRLGQPLSMSVPDDGLRLRREFQPRTFAELLDEARGDGSLRRSVESIWTDDPISASRIVSDALALAPSADSTVYLGFRKYADLPADAACSVLRRGFLFVDAAWRERADDSANMGWVDDVLTRLHPYDTGGYINETDWYRHPERVAKCYSSEAIKKLGEINRRHDPAGTLSRAHFTT